MGNNGSGLQPGSTLRYNSYRIEKIIGQGGFGITYLAYDLNLHRKVAIKEFFPKNFCSRNGDTSHVTLKSREEENLVSKLKAKFLKEARNIATFDYPGIIKIHAAFEENDTAYYVMDYIEGVSLNELVKTQGPLDENRAMRYIRQVAKALEYVHARKINHLDVKPANIMIRESDDEAILIDFGLSKRYDKDGKQTSETPPGVSHGFAPTEQYKTNGVKEFSPQTDVYSLAATLYYALSGVVPPDAPTLIDEELSFPASIPSHLFGPIEKAMTPKRLNRHDSIARFIQDISPDNSSDSNYSEDNTDTVYTDESEKDNNSVETSYFEHNDTEYADTGSQSQKDFSEMSSPEEWEDTSNRKTGIKNWVWYGLIGIGASVLAVILFVFLPKGTTVSGSDTDSVAEKQVNVGYKMTVTNMTWESPLGPSVYTGEVNEEMANNNGEYIPDGRGTCEITGGDLKGCVYEGTFENGQMNGRASYTLPSGDRFVGTFKDNQYEKGRYTVKENGEYFEGTFRNGTTDKGRWYNNNKIPID